MDTNVDWDAVKEAVGTKLGLDMKAIESINVKFDPNQPLAKVEYKGVGYMPAAEFTKIVDDIYNGKAEVQ